MIRSLLLLVCSLYLPLAWTAQVKVATVQFASVDGDFDANLVKISKLTQIAKDQGAEVTLLPEFAFLGYNLSPAIWKLAEPSGGPTQQALAKLAQETNMYIGSTYLEVEGEHFFNTFILVNPQGRLAGSVRKQVPAGAEGYFFSGHINHHVISTSLGNIGVGICQENYRCFLPLELHQGDADFVLMPFSYPDLSDAGGLESPKGTYIAQWYANQLGIPIITSNKTGVWPQVEGAFFPGLSAAVSGDGKILGELNNKPGVLVVDIVLDSSIKSQPTAQCIGPFIKNLTIGSWLQKRITWASIWVGEIFDADPDDEIRDSYLSSKKRRAAALSLHPNFRP